MKNMLSCILFTRKSNSPQGYEDYPTFLGNVWPLLESHIHMIRRIYAFQHKESTNIGTLIEYSKVFQGFYDLGKGDAILPELIPQIKYLSYYEGDRNIFYEIGLGPFLNEFLSIWPHKSKIHQDIKVIGFTGDDYKNVYNFANKVCGDEIVLTTFFHDADTMCVIGQFNTLEHI